VLVLDWDEGEALRVRAALSERGFVVNAAADPHSGWRELQRGNIDVLLTPPSVQIDGTGIIDMALEHDSRLRVVVASDLADLEGTAMALATGAHDYLLRPIGSEQAVSAVLNAWTAHSHTTASGEPQAQLLQVLLLEAHPLQAQLVGAVLGQAGGFATTRARDLEQAAQLLTERDFDALLYRTDGGRSETIRRLHELRGLAPEAALVLLAPGSSPIEHDTVLRLGAEDVIRGQRLGREALGARVRNAVARTHYRLVRERFVRDLQTRGVGQTEPPRSRDAEARFAERVSSVLPTESAALGQLAAGVTHEINNPAAYVVANLTSMQDLVEELERSAPPDPAARAKLRELGEMVRENLGGMSRIRSITSDLGALARIDEAHETASANLALARLEAPDPHSTPHVAQALEAHGSHTTEAVPRKRSTRRLRLLFVDDEPLVLRSLCRMLAEHDVQTAQTVSEALRRLREGPGYDLIFCDMMMPEMDGTVFYSELERETPALLERVIFCSGGVFTSRTKQFLEHCTRPLLEKPMTRESFERVLAEHCGEPRLDLA
jgi:DNA-binding NarL/FixJ family response regulator